MRWRNKQKGILPEFAEKKVFLIFPKKLPIDGDLLNQEWRWLETASILYRKVYGLRNYESYSFIETNEFRILKF